MEKSMILYSSEWKGEKTFKMMPADLNCPYVEVIWDTTVSILAIVSKVTRETYQMLTVLDSNGDPEKRKTQIKDKSPYKNERRLNNVQIDHYLDDKNEIISFIESIAINAKDFDYKKYVNASIQITANENSNIVNLSENAIKVVK